jgi:hypothetical protein
MPNSVNASLDHLVRYGLVRELTGRKRNRLFAYMNCMNILNEHTLFPSHISLKGSDGLNNRYRIVIVQFNAGAMRPLFEKCSLIPARKAAHRVISVKTGTPASSAAARYAS